MNFPLQNIKNVIFLGDTHSISETQYIIEEKIPKNSLIIQCGDLGVGFAHLFSEEKIFIEIVGKLRKLNSKLIAIRGNHDDPKYFTEYHTLNKKYSNDIYLASDYTRFCCNGKSFLLVGGAISVDRIIRTINRTWWIDEEFFLAKSKIIHSDILVTHSSPDYCAPVEVDQSVKNWASIEHKVTKGISNLLEELIKERKKISELVSLVNPKLHVYGHFHFSNYEVIGDRIYKLLGINELWELPCVENKSSEL